MNVKLGKRISVPLKPNRLEELMQLKDKLYLIGYNSEVCEYYIKNKHLRREKCVIIHCVNHLHGIGRESVIVMVDGWERASWLQTKEGRDQFWYEVRVRDLHIVSDRIDV